VHTMMVRRRLRLTTTGSLNVRMHGIGVHFHPSMGPGWDKAANFDGTLCGAAAHAVVLALQELLRHPDDLDKNWRIETSCRYLIDAIQTGTTCRSIIEDHRSKIKDERSTITLCRFPRPVQLTEVVVRDET
ncbi:hypothetical protein PMAYCL1PPCAC_08568, partial [Pristionchus mayeri]